jgi:N-acyl-D-amino-acid deacylase
MKRLSRNRTNNTLARRRFLRAIAAGAVSLPGADWAYGQVSGAVEPKLAAYDDLMKRFMAEFKPPGAALAVAYHGRLVYARGFGHADFEKREPVEPASLFRIASLSKSFTAAAVLHLVEKGHFKLDDKVFRLLKIEPHLQPGAKVDPRLYEIEVQHCLHHTGGWDRDKSLDPMGADAAEEVAKELKVQLPITPLQIVRVTMGKRLDFAPGTKYVYSNYGYCVLGRLIQEFSQRPYHEFVTQQILAPIGIRQMRLGKNLLVDRAPGEVKYYDSGKRTGRAISGPNIGKQVPLPYGVECIETMDANGGWIASAVDLVRWAVALDDPRKCRVLNTASMEAMLAPPPGPVGHGPKGKPKETYYGCGWEVRPNLQKPGTYTKWHTGGLAGSSTLLVCRDDGIDWAVLFNCDAPRDGQAFADLIDPLLHKPGDEIWDWPKIDLFARF